MPHKTIRVPISDETAESLKVGASARVVISGTITEITASRIDEFPFEGQVDTVIPAHVELEVSLASVSSTNDQIDVLMGAENDEN